MYSQAEKKSVGAKQNRISGFYMATNKQKGPNQQTNVDGEDQAPCGWWLSHAFLRSRYRYRYGLHRRLRDWHHVTLVLTCFTPK